MKSLPVVRPQGVRYERDSTFSYACHACGRCCYHKIIHLNPYEVARLAQNRGISTTEFLSHYTAANGTAVKQQNDGACIFLTSQGCGVHSDRPLVCRLYPLGRQVTAEAEEWFSETAPHPESEGEYSTDGTVEEFLTTQGAQPFIEAVDRYVELVGQMSHVLLTKTIHDAKAQQHVEELIEGFVQGQDQEISVMLDMDQIVGRFCADQGVPIPSNVNEKMDLHIQVVEEWLHNE
ncbi:MAG: YkgJ family cysteine cluster protein [Nitrospirota bacterium]|nr:YkgJ family cysteine cluster protein [Nitrospirota bacterium]